MQTTIKIKIRIQILIRTQIQVKISNLFAIHVTPGHTSRNCNKQFNMNQQLQKPPQQQQQQQQQEFDKQENSNALPGTGAQRRA